MDALRGFLGRVVGTETDAVLYPPSSYEDVHSSAQSVLLPPLYPHGCTVHVVQPLGRHFASQGKMQILLNPEPPKVTFMGPVPSPGLRNLSLGLIGSFSDPLLFGGKWRVAALAGAPTRATLLGDVWGNGRLRVFGAAAKEGAALSATLTGEDYVAVARARRAGEGGGGGELLASYNQRLAPGSPLQVGGECCVSLKSLAAGAGSGGAGTVSPFEFAVGAAWDGGTSRSALHFSRYGSYATGTLSAQHSLRVTERATLASKLIVNLESKHSMVAAGYRLHFRNTLTTLHGTVDSYGSLKQMVEYEPMKDFRVGLSLEAKSLAEAHVGMKVTLGPLPKVQIPLSPLTMSRALSSGPLPLPPPHPHPFFAPRGSLTTPRMRSHTRPIHTAGDIFGLAP
jgi:hypothetical protein